MRYSTVILTLIIALHRVQCYTERAEPVIMVHGGADNIPEYRIKARLDGVKRAAAAGYRILRHGGDAVDAVEAAVRALEEDENFNAGLGSNLNLDGEQEMDASIMAGATLNTGTVAVVRNVAHPVGLARLVMERSPHFGLAGEGARRFARDRAVPLVQQAPPRWARADLDDAVARPNRTGVEMRGGGGVGAVAIDARGNTAAACSSGGTTGKLPGRMSHAAVIGAAIYADNEVGAVAAMGLGESAVRYSLAHEIISNMKRGFDPGMATRNAVKGLTERFHRPSGAITLSKNGQIGISFTSEKMAWAYQIRDDVHFGIDDYDDFREKITL